MELNKFARFTTYSLIVLFFILFLIFKKDNIEIKRLPNANVAVVNRKEIPYDDIEVSTRLEKLPYSITYEDNKTKIYIPKPIYVGNDIITLDINGNIKRFKSNVDQKIEILDIFPKINQKEVNLYPNIYLKMDTNIKEVYMSGIDGEVNIKENTVNIVLDKLLTPNKEYKIKLGIVSDEKKRSKFVEMNFRTINSKRKQVLEVITEGVNRLRVYKEGKIIKTFLASTGIENKTPKGIFDIKDKGLYFYSETYNGGGKYWTRIKDDYLIHGVARDKSGLIKKEELAKIGEPASAGCVRLKDEDAKWIYDNVEEGSLIIIR